MKRLKVAQGMINRGPLKLSLAHNTLPQRRLSHHMILAQVGNGMVPFRSSHPTRRPFDENSPGGIGNKEDEERQRQNRKRSSDKKANLGLMITMLQTTVPDLLNSPIPSEFISSDIVLRILPRSYPNWPTFKGPMIYQTTVKTLQLLITSLYLNPDIKLHITNIKVIEPMGTSLLTDEELCDLGLSSSPIERGDANLQRDSMDIYGGISPYSTKVIVKWRTCLDGCQHLLKFKSSSHHHGQQISNENDNSGLTFSTLSARLGVHNLSTAKDINPMKLFDSLNSLTPAMLKNLIHSGNSTLVSDSADGISNNKSHDGQTQDKPIREFISKPSERVMSGLFIFELTADNSKISVHTIDDVEIIEDDEYSHSGRSQNGNQAFAG